MKMSSTVDPSVESEPNSKSTQSALHLTDLSLPYHRMQVPSLAAALRRIAGRCLPLPRVPTAALAAAATEGGSWRDVEAALRALGGVESEDAGLRQRSSHAVMVVILAQLNRCPEVVLRTAAGDCLSVCLGACPLRCSCRKLIGPVFPCHTPCWGRS